MMKVPALVIVCACALVACSRSKESRCEEFADQGIGMVMALANAAGDKLAGEDIEDVELPAAERAQVRQAAIRECMSWPEDFVECMTGPDAEFDSPKCRAAVAAKEGVVVAVDGARGPDPAVRVIGGEVGLMCHVGVCLLQGDDGKLAKTTGGAAGEGSFVGVLEIEGERVAVSAKDGELTLHGKKQARTIKAPRPEPDASLWQAMATSPEARLVLFDGGVARLEPPLSEDCDGCWKSLGWQVRDRYGSPPSSWDAPEIHAYPGGVAVWLLGGRLTVFADGEQAPRFTLRVKDELGMPLVVGDDVFIGAGKEALRLSLARCRSESPAEPAELTGDGCIEARFELPETAYARPVRLGEAVYFLADGRVYQMKADGTKGWAAEVEGDDLMGVERDGKRTLLTASRWTFDHPARLVALDPDSGTTLMQVDLPESEMSIYDVQLERDGDAILALTSKRLYRWDLGALEALAAR